ncbi:MAG: DUF4037 domain-containing protein [Lentisphaeria bacterium]|jgi:hypothetical protein|nr:DUF4037 domain-containing protein [Lentisphaeria bacterium]
MNPQTDISGLALARGFFRDCVAPVVARTMPGLRYSAGMVGPGSEVLGYDTAVSRDHHWGPRAMLFLESDALAQHGPALTAALAGELPREYLGYSTNFSEPDGEDHGVQRLVPVVEGPVNHRVELLEPGAWFREYLGAEVVSRPPEVREWLSFPHQKLRSLVAGEWFRDDLGLGAVGDRLRWYPEDVWRYVLASGWQRISQDEHLMGRAGQAGDELGSAIIAARLARDAMRLGFLMERVYPPYAKWFGTAFRELDCAAELTPPLVAALAARTYPERGEALAAAYAALARRHNRLGLTPLLDPSPRPFFGRPFPVIFGERFAGELVRGIADPVVRELCRRPLLGSLDMFSDSTDLLEDTGRSGGVQALF